MTMRYEWNDSIEFEVNPENPEYLKYFTDYWNEEMAKLFFPAKSKIGELSDAFQSLVSIMFRVLRNWK